MSLLIGTGDGVYRSASGALDDVERVLDSGVTLRVRTFEHFEGVFATSKTGLYRSVDGGTTWENLGVPREEVFSVVGSPDGARLYAGTHPAHLYVSRDQGETWDELDGFQELPSQEQWHTPRHRDSAHVRSLGVHSDAPERVIAGIEVGGVHVSEDNGETWSERRDGLPERGDDLQYDVHHVLVLGADEYVVSCGGGLYRTHDAGRSWRRLDTGSNYPYFQEAFAYRGRLYAAAETLPPSPPAALFESVGGGDSFESLPYPGEPDEFVVAWTAVGGRILAGTTKGRVIAREDDGWITLGRVPAGIGSLTSA
ncbi:MAG: glycosyl hydrolase [Euryarchaeota archaeon]|nr:glycosyl hydrolase [Euryarchaeota archaeon]